MINNHIRTHEKTLKEKFKTPEAIATAQIAEELFVQVPDIIRQLKVLNHTIKNIPTIKAPSRLNFEEVEIKNVTVSEKVKHSHLHAVNVNIDIDQIRYKVDSFLNMLLFGLISTWLLIIGGGVWMMTQ